MTLIHSIDTLTTTRRLLQLITRFIVWGCQPGPSDGHVTMDELISDLERIAKEAVQYVGSVETVAVSEVVRVSSVCHYANFSRHPAQAHLKLTIPSRLEFRCLRSAAV